MVLDGWMNAWVDAWVDGRITSIKKSTPVGGQHEKIIMDFKKKLLNRPNAFILSLV